MLPERRHYTLEGAWEQNVPLSPQPPAAAARALRWARQWSVPSLLLTFVHEKGDLSCSFSDMKWLIIIPCRTGCLFASLKSSGGRLRCSDPYHLIFHFPWVTTFGTEQHADKDDSRLCHPPLFLKRWATFILFLSDSNKRGARRFNLPLEF